MKHLIIKATGAILIVSLFIPTISVFAQELSGVDQGVTPSLINDTLLETTKQDIVPEVKVDIPIDVQDTDDEGTEPIIPPEDTVTPPLASEPITPFRDASRDVISSLNIKTNTMSGTMEYSYPLNLPPARGKVTPVLSLVYRSQSNENVNVYGYGWSDTIPYIERINRTGSEKMFSANNFTSSFDGELRANNTSTPTESYGAKIENGAFLTYEYIDNSKWLVTDKQGTTYKFGYSTTTQQYDTASTTKIYKWLLEETRDTNNNFSKYEYFHDGNQIYPSKITYAGHDTTDGIFEIEFLRESRSDVATSTQATFPIASNYRINEIQIKINGVWARKYNLSYSIGSNGRRSLLSSVTESGLDENSNLTTLPATTFTYQSSGTKGWTQNNTITSPHNFITSGRKDKGVRLLDVNGDGLVDVMASGPTGTTSINKTWVRTATGWGEVTAWQQPDGVPVIDSDYRDPGIRFADVNGDGLTDVLLAEENSHTKRTWINNRGGWSQDAVWESPVYFSDIGVGDRGSRIVDVNGDGLADILQATSNNLYATTSVAYINNGAGWTASETWESPVPFMTLDRDTGARIVDVNGDGLVDLLFWREFSGFSVENTYINNGKGWAFDTSWSMPSNFYFAGVNGADRGVRLVDVNGDGLTDLIRGNYSLPGSGQVFVNTGVGWVQDSNWSLNWPTFTDNDYLDQGARFIDVNNDGMEDIMHAWDDHNNDTYINNSKKVDLLTTIGHTGGATSTVIYKSAGLYTDGGTLLNPHVRQNYDTVEQIAINAGLGMNATTTFIYEGGDYYYAGPYDRHPVGFKKITKTDSAGNTTKTSYHLSTTTDWARISKPYRIEVADVSGNIYSTSLNTWATSSLSNGREYVKLNQTVEQTFDGDTSHKDKAESYTYDGTGNLLQKKQWGEVNGNDDGTFSDTGTDDFTTTISYASSTTSHVVLLATESTVDHSSTKIAEARHYYDSSTTLGDISLGNETKTEQWKSGSSYASTTKTYNGYGLVTQQLDPRGKQTTIVYDQYNLYPATTTNPLNQDTAYLYDYTLGKPKLVKDTNNLIFQTIYDGLDRVVEEKQPDLATPSTLVSKATYSYTDNVLPRIVQKNTYIDTSTSIPSYTYLDGLGRVIQERSKAEASNVYAVKDTLYNNLGLKLKESLPYFDNGTSFTASTSNNALFTTYSYDPLQRIKKIENAVGSTTNFYDDWKLTTYDPRSKQKSYYRDALNNLIKVDEVNGGSTYTTNYNYDGNGNLTKITDALGNIRNFTYNGLNQRLTAEDLHASGDGSFDTWTFTYDNNGNVLEMTDPNTQVTDYTYDDLNRPLTENWVGLTGTEFQYAYDTCAYGKGRLCFATTTPSVTTITKYKYSSLGSVIKEKKTINTKDFTTLTTYNLLGNMTSLTYPDYATTTYSYNPAGLLETVNFQATSSPSATPIITNLDYTPLGQVGTTTYGNGVTTTNTYNQNLLYRLQNKLTKNSANLKLQDNTYTYDAVGNITALADASEITSAKSASYTYDDLNRLTNATVYITGTTTPYNHSYTYNEIGNILTKTGAGSYTYAGGATANPMAATTIGSNNYTYDTNGNVLTTGAGKYINTWDFRNRLSQTQEDFFGGEEQMMSGGEMEDFGYEEQEPILMFGQTQYAYDHNDQRVRLASGSTATYFPNKFYNLISNNGTTTKHIYANDTLVATVELGPAPLKALATSTILFDASSTSITTGYNAGPVTYTWSHTATSSPYKTLILTGDIWQDTAGVGTITSATDNGASFTKALATRSGGMACEVWYLNATTTTNNLSVTVTGAQRAVKLSATTFSGVATTSALKATSTSTGSADDDFLPTVSVTTTPGNLFLATVSRYGTESASTNRTSIFNDTATSTLGASSYHIATTTTSSDTYSPGAYRDWCMGASVFKQATTTATTTGIQYVINDHLGGTNVVTDSSGNVVETLDYYPYGEVRLDNKASIYKGDKRKFTDHEYDTETGWNYMNARYEDGKMGKFLSQDQQYLAVAYNLSDPQSMNSYSYARNNPVVMTDPNGKDAKFIALYLSGYTVGGLQTVATPFIDLVRQQVNPRGYMVDTTMGMINTAQSVYSLATDPKGTIVNGAQAFSELSPYQQGNIAGGTVTSGAMIAQGVSELMAAGGATKGLSNNALVARGGSLANQTAEKIGEKISSSRTPGVTGFSVQCSNACTNIDQLGELGQYLPNNQMAVTTVGNIRKAGGDVVKTLGPGNHATVTGLNGNQASPLFQNIVKNANPFKFNR